LDGGSSSRGRARLAGAVLAVFVVATGAGNASAARQPPPQPPPDASAVDAYRESVPTSAGTHVVGSRVQRVVPLPPAIETRVRGDAGRSAALLEHVATSSDLGAPVVRSHTAAAASAAAAEPRGGWAPRGAAAAVVDELAGSVGLLGVFAVAAAAVALLLRRRRSDA
jgi:hypothetical protein